MIKRFNKARQDPYYRINERIVNTTLRVLDLEGKQLGIFSKFEALQKAREAGLDLVEVAPKATPAVARIIDFKKFLYQQEKKKREEKRKARVSETKEVRLGPFMNDHDLQVMIRRAQEFIEDGDKVRLVLKFKGRQIIHPEFGQATMGKVIKALFSVSKTEREAHFEGKQLIALIVPDKKKSPVKQGEEEKTDENKEISSKEV